MAKNQTQTEQERSLSRRENYPFPSLGGDLFSWSPFALLREMTDWMDRSMSGFPQQQGAGAGTGTRTHQWSPAIEVRQKDNNLIVSADLPGLDPKDVKLEVDNDYLVIQGERKQEHTEEREGWHRTERSYGSFYRSIPLPEGARTDQAKADFRNGVLEIKIPFEQSKSTRHQIQIQGAGTAAASAHSMSTQTGSTQR